MFRRILASTLVVLLVLTAFPAWTGTSVAQRFDWAALAVDEASVAADTNNNEQETSDAPQKKQGNGFVRALGAPFRAIGRLFGGGKKNDNQARRISDKDAAKFESTKLTRVKDTRVEAPAATTPSLTNTPFNDHLQRGRELLNTGDFSEAIAELSTAASLDPNSGEANNLLGIAYESKGLRDRALKSFEAAVHVDKNNAQFLNNFGFLLFKNNDFDAASKYLKRAAKVSPNDARIWNNLGLAQCQRGKFDDAYESFVRAVGEFGGRLNMAAQLQQRGFAKEAIKHLEKAQALSPNSTDVIGQLISLYDMTGRVSDAQSARKSLLALRTFAEANK
jgi:Flp pilus assembly protein TadD